MPTRSIGAPSALEFASEYRSKVLSALETVRLEEVSLAIEILQEARARDRHIFVCGNGGSASTASHFVCDMVKGASFQRQSRFRILALTDSLPTITAYSNDVGYDCIFVEQLKNFAQPDDVFLAISGSGNSPNVVCAMEYANSIGCQTIALTGRDGGKLGQLAKLQIRVAEPHMGRIEDAHLIVCHMLCYYFMEN
jgi:D-sedoheptulose 7-phosphate isomerase